MIAGGFRKTIGLFCLAMGIGIFLTIVLPLWGWIGIVAIAISVFGISWLFC